MNPLNQKLRDMFRFSSRDLLANRAGRLSPRQAARQEALATNLMVGIGAAVAAILGALVVFGFGRLVSGSAAPAGSSDDLVSGIVLGVVVLVIVVFTVIGGWQQVRKVRSTVIHKAEGIAQRGKTRADAGHFEIKIGNTPIRLLTALHREAFQVGTAYRVFYLPAAVPTILSAEVVGTESEAAETIGPETPIEQDDMLKYQHNARRVAVVLVALTLLSPIALLATPRAFQLFTGLGLAVVYYLFWRWALSGTGNDHQE